MLKVGLTLVSLGGRGRPVGRQPYNQCRSSSLSWKARIFLFNEILDLYSFGPLEGQTNLYYYDLRRERICE
jgi:hypothetical protein